MNKNPMHKPFSMLLKLLEFALKWINHQIHFPEKLNRHNKKKYPG